MTKKWKLRHSIPFTFIKYYFSLFKMTNVCSSLSIVRTTKGYYNISNNCRKMGCTFDHCGIVGTRNLFCMSRLGLHHSPCSNKCQGYVHHSAIENQIRALYSLPPSSLSTQNVKNELETGFSSFMKTLIENPPKEDQTQFKDLPADVIRLIYDQVPSRSDIKYNAMTLVCKSFHTALKTKNVEAQWNCRVKASSVRSSKNNLHRSSIANSVSRVDCLSMLQKYGFSKDGVCYIDIPNPSMKPTVENIEMYVSRDVIRLKDPLVMPKTKDLHGTYTVETATMKLYLEAQFGKIVALNLHKHGSLYFTYRAKKVDPGPPNLLNTYASVVAGRPYHEFVWHPKNMSIGKQSISELILQTSDGLYYDMYGHYQNQPIMVIRSYDTVKGQCWGDYYVNSYKTGEHIFHVEFNPKTGERISSTMFYPNGDILAFRDKSSCRTYYQTGKPEILIELGLDGNRQKVEVFDRDGTVLCFAQKKYASILHITSQFHVDQYFFM